MLRSNLNPDCLELALRNLSELAGDLKVRRLRRALHSAVRRGQSPVLSLSAAVSASLVSAAAKELNEDPLAGIVTVDDLSSLTDEICLPTNSYPGAAQHDHEPFGRALSHAGNHGRPFYLDDPFASPYANGASAAHANHHARAIGADHEPSPYGSIHAQHSAWATGAVARAEHGQHGAHQKVEAVNQHVHHDAENTNASDRTAHASHGGDHAAHDTASAHAGHQASAPQIHGLHEMHSDNGDELSAFINSMSQDMNVTASPHDEAHGETGDASGADMIVSSPQPNAVASHEHHHGVSLAAMDLPSSDDLSTVQTSPVI